MNSEQADLVAAYRRDYQRFATERLRIITKKDGLQPFVFNAMQRKLWDVVKEDLDAGRPIRLFILKARQLGSSTFAQGLAFWRTALHAYQNALTVSHEETSAGSLFTKQQVFYSNLPDWLRPNIRRSNRQELYFTGKKPGDKGLESRHLIATANNRNLGASQTLHFLHMSEYARYEALLQDIDLTMASVLPTVPYAPETFIIIETTAQGLGHAKDVWDSDNEYRKIFTSFVASENYTHDEPIDISTIQTVDADPWGNEQALLDTIYAELDYWYPDLQDRDLEALKRLNWRRQQIKSFNYNRGLFRQEYPLTPEEAFITSGQTVFSPLKLADVMKRVESQNYESTSHRFDLDSNSFYEAPNGHLSVYMRPSRNGIYVIGADSGYGTDKGDFSTAQVLRVPEFDQVAVFQDRVEPDDFAKILNALGHWYNTAAICPETLGAGMATVLKLHKDLLYPYLYTREIFDKIENIYREQVGFLTTQSSKPVLVSELISAFHDDLIRFRDMGTLEEMSFFTEKSGKFNAEPGKHDDLVIALALALQMSRQIGYVSRSNEDSTIMLSTVAEEIEKLRHSEESPWRL